MQLQEQSPRQNNIRIAINAWLKTKESESGSIRTGKIYSEYLTSFREILQLSGLDLDGLPIGRNPSEEEKDKGIALIAFAAQNWAGRAQRKEKVSSSTYNQRLAVLSSFYSFAKKRRFISIDNPIDMIERGKVQEYANAQPLTKEQVMQVLGGIDRSVLAGKRDYALLLALISTGRRASEILGLQWKDVHIEGDVITLHFEYCKGGVKMRDKLEPRVAKPLMEYQRSLIKQDLGLVEPERFVWVSLSMKRLMQPLTQRGLADIFKSRLGTMKVHTTRHTFAYNMDKSGASTTDIQERLGHSNIATTGKYLKQLKSDENKHASQLLDFLGIE
jgi:integrase